MVPSLPPSKPALRDAALKARRAYAQSLTPEVRQALEAALEDIVLPRLIGAKIVSAYHPLRDEISPYPILEKLGPGQRVALPWFADRDARMIWREAPANEPSPWGVLQPSATADGLAPDLVLVPLVAADRNCTRIGHGKGHYDRAIAHLRAGNPRLITIGLAWDTQILDDPIPGDPWDEPLDAIATPKEWIQCRKK